MPLVMIAWHLFGLVIVDLVVFFMEPGSTMGKLEVHDCESHDGDHSHRNLELHMPSAVLSVLTNESAQLDACMHVQAPPADVNVLWGWASHGMLQTHRVAVR